MRQFLHARMKHVVFCLVTIDLVTRLCDFSFFIPYKHGIEELAMPR